MKDGINCGMSRCSLDDDVVVFWLRNPMLYAMKEFHQFLRCFIVTIVTLWLFNIAMEAMAHRNRWFTY